MQFMIVCIRDLLAVTDYIHACLLDNLIIERELNAGDFPFCA